MKRDSIIFHSKSGCVFKYFSLRRWFWKTVSLLSFVPMTTASWVGNYLYELGNTLFNRSYSALDVRNPLRAPLYRSGLWIETNAWALKWMGDQGYKLFTLGYSRSGGELLEAFNKEVGCEHLSTTRRLSNSWSEPFSFYSTSHPLPLVNLNGKSEHDQMAREALSEYENSSLIQDEQRRIAGFRGLRLIVGPLLSDIEIAHAITRYTQTGRCDVGNISLWMSQPCPEAIFEFLPGILDRALLKKHFEIKRCVEKLFPAIIASGLRDWAKTGGGGL